MGKFDTDLLDFLQKSICTTLPALLRWLYDPNFSTAAKVCMQMRYWCCTFSYDGLCSLAVSPNIVRYS